MRDFDVCLFLCPGDNASGWSDRCAEIEAYARAARACGLTDAELEDDILAFWPLPGLTVEVTTGLDRTVCIYLVTAP